jgi:protocatechuate 3,4-dioxygenase beta subunit
MKSRRSFLLGMLAGLPLAIFSRVLRAGQPTPPETEGPFYPLYPQKDKDFDLTQVQGRPGQARGRVITIQGLVLDTEGRAIEDATVELWQANAAGRYRHPSDRNTAPLDPNFQGWAIVKSGREGRFQFRTIFPGSYPASAEWMRPPHIHFKVSKRGFAGLTTQMYFPGQKLNDSDLLLMQKSDAEAARMIATRAEDTVETYVYQIVLAKA